MKGRRITNVELKKRNNGTTGRVGGGGENQNNIPLDIKVIYVPPSSCEEGSKQEGTKGVSYGQNGAQERDGEEQEEEEDQGGTECLKWLFASGPAMQLPHSFAGYIPTP